MCGNAAEWDFNFRFLFSFCCITRVTNKLKLQTVNKLGIFRCLAPALAGAVLLSVAMPGCSDSAWPQLKGVDPSGSILNDPPRLISLIVQKTNGSATELRSEALNRLIAKQKRRLESRSQGATGIDHQYVEVVSTNEFQVRLLCTPPDAKKIHAAEGTYSPLEYLTFNWSGVLIGRDPYIETANKAPNSLKEN